MLSVLYTHAYKSPQYNVYIFALNSDLYLIWRWFSMSPLLSYGYSQASTCVCVCVCVCVCACVCLTLFDPMDCIPPGSSVHGILQARILERVAISSSRESSWLKDWTRVYCLCLLHWQADSLPLEPPGQPQAVTEPLKPYLSVDSYLSVGVRKLLL